MKKYRLLRDAFLWKAHCCHCFVNAATDVHHAHGRIGNLLFYTHWWRPLCRECHTKVENNKDWARSVGLLCAAGEWNKMAVGVQIEDLPSIDKKGRTVLVPTPYSLQVVGSHTMPIYDFGAIHIVETYLQNKE